MKEEVYRLEGVGYQYGEVTALQSIELSVFHGECLSVLGTNGSGKSTLLKVLDGLYFPSMGKVSFSGEPLTEGYAASSSFRQRVGFVFEEPDVQLFSSSVFDEVAFGPLQIGLGAEEVKKRTNEVMDMLGLSPLKDRPPHTLSSGEKRKVAIASVLSINPGVLLLDEPTNGLDPRTQVWLLELLGELKGLKKTLVIATHDLSLVEDVSDRVAVLDESHKIVSDGTTNEILGNKELLLRTNLIHEHSHRHGKMVHTHSHAPFSVHDEHE
jgi:cobalt/nickel transport system ATP-binding protein